MRLQMRRSVVRARSATVIAGLVGMVLLTTPTVRADDYVWNNAGGGNYEVAGNWNPGNGPPAAADNATISTAGVYTVALTDNRAITNLTLNNATTTLNQGICTLTLGGTLALSAGTIADSGGTISGGTITSGGGQLQLRGNNNNQLLNVAVGAGVLDFSTNSARVRLQGTTTLAAGTVVNMTGATSILAFEQTATANNLTINLIGGAYLSVEGDHTLTLGPATTVTNSGTGVITGALYFSATTAILNQGLIRNTGAGTLNIEPGAFTNQPGGTVRAESGVVNFNSANNLTNFAGSTLTGGNWEVWGNATLEFGNRNIATLAAGTTVVFNGANPTFAALDSLTANNGTLRVLGGKTFNPTAASVTNAGLIQVSTASTFGKAISIQTGGLLEGAGTVTGAVTVAGTIAPGVTGTPIGTLTTGGQTWAGGGVYEISYGKSHGAFTAGIDNDYLTSPAGALAVTATSGSKFHLRMDYTGMDLLQDSEVTIKIATFAGGVPATFDLSQFQLEGNVANGSVIQLTSVGNDVFLTFTPVPEPGALLLIGAAGSGVVVVVRRLRRTVATMAGSGRARIMTGLD